MFAKTLESYSLTSFARFSPLCKLRLPRSEPMYGQPALQLKVERRDIGYIVVNIVLLALMLCPSWLQNDSVIYFVRGVLTGELVYMRCARQAVAFSSTSAVDLPKMDHSVSPTRKHPRFVPVFA
jgi:hypothetical protein